MNEAPARKTGLSTKENISKSIKATNSISSSDLKKIQREETLFKSLDGKVDKTRRDLHEKYRKKK